MGNTPGPLVVCLAKRQEYEFVDDPGKKALNFQITFTLVEVALFFLPAILIMRGLFVLNIGLVIMAAIRSNEGTSYWYPFTLRIVT